MVVKRFMVVITWRHILDIWCEVVVGVFRSSSSVGGNWKLAPMACDKFV